MTFHRSKNVFPWEHQELSDVIDLPLFNTIDKAINVLLWDLSVHVIALSIEGAEYK